MSNNNPKLITGNDAKTAAENILIELKYYFPKHNFAVITDVGANVIDVMPETKDISVEEIKKITTKYELWEDHDEVPRRRPKVDCSFNEIHGGTSKVFIIPPFEPKPHRIV